MSMLLTAAQATTLEFIKSFCDRFVLVRVELDSTKGKHTKVPVISKWTSITPEKSQKFKSKDWRHFMFVVGEESGLFVVDLDRKNVERQDHDGYFILLRCYARIIHI